MLTKFDLLAESLLQEGRKKDELKKFKLDLDIAKQIVDELEDGHEDKSHFKSILDKLTDKPFHTPKTFKEDVARIFRKLKKDDIADGYAKIFYKFLVDHESNPCSTYTETESDESDKDESEETSEEVETSEEKPEDNSSEQEKDIEIRDFPDHLA